MQEKELGFVLKRFLPSKQKLSILSCNKGKILLITQPIQKCTQLWPGMLISFKYLPFNPKIFLANEIDIIMCQPKIDYHYIRWVHQVLELCYYFAPLEQPCPEIFYHLYNSLLIFKFEQHFPDKIELIKKIYLLKFFELIGIYPEKDLIKYFSLYEQITSKSVDFEDTQKVESLRSIFDQMAPINVQKIDSWISSCIKAHPCCNFFKTGKVI